MTKNKKYLLIVLIIIIIPILFWCGSLVKCEVLTRKYYADFEYAYTNNTMLGETEYFKVINCDGEKAEVYYVSNDMTDANVLSFGKQNDTWVETEWKTVWSSSGSASGAVYPYWWHFIYGGL